MPTRYDCWSGCRERITQKWTAFLPNHFILPSILPNYFIQTFLLPNHLALTSFLPNHVLQLEPVACLSVPHHSGSRSLQTQQRCWVYPGSERRQVGESERSSDNVTLEQTAHLLLPGHPLCAPTCRWTAVSSKLGPWLMYITSARHICRYLYQPTYKQADMTCSFL